MTYTEMPLPEQLTKITAEKDHAADIGKIGDRWLAAQQDLHDAGMNLVNDSRALHESWADQNGAKFDQRAQESAKTVIGWADAITAAKPWEPVKALVEEIPRVYDFVKEAARKAAELQAQLDSLAGQVLSDADALGGVSPFSEATLKAEGLAADIKQLQHDAGVQMDALATKYTDLGKLLAGLKGPAWAGPTLAEAPGVSGPAAPSGATPSGAAPSGAGGPAGGGSALAGGPGAATAPAPAGGGAGAPGGGPVPSPVVPPVRPSPRTPVTPSPRTPVRPSVPGVVGSRGGSRGGGSRGVAGVARSGIPQAAVVPPAAQATPVNGPAPTPSTGAAAATSGAAAGTPMFPPPMGGAAGHGGGSSARPGPGNAVRRPQGRGRLPERTPGLSAQLGGRAGKLDPRTSPEPKTRVTPVDAPLDDELWAVGEVPKPLERRPGL